MENVPAISGARTNIRLSDVASPAHGDVIATDTPKVPSGIRCQPGRGS